MKNTIFPIAKEPFFSSDLNFLKYIWYFLKDLIYFKFNLTYFKLVWSLLKRLDFFQIELDFFENYFTYF